jgi:hypothetical protein
VLGRKNYTPEELDSAKAAVAEQLAAIAALEGLEPVLVNNLVLALDRRFVHRIRVISGKDGNALNEVELIVDSLVDNDGVLRGNKVIKYVPAESVVKLELGDRIALSVEQFERLSAAFLAEIDARFVRQA